MITMHPGAYLKMVYLDTNMLNQKTLAGKLGVSTSALCRVLSGKADVSPEFALKLEKALDRSAESWLYMQIQYSLNALRASKGQSEKQEVVEPLTDVKHRGGRVVTLD